MAINFGAPPRQESQVVKSTDEHNADFASQEAAYRKKLDDIEWARQQIQSPVDYAQGAATAYGDAGGFDSFFADQAKYNPIWNTQAQQDWYKAAYAADVAPTIATPFSQLSAQDQAYIGKSDVLMDANRYSPSAVSSGLDQDSAAATDEFTKQKAAFEAFTANQTRQQQAYNQQSGGGFAGGIIDESYSNPFSNQISGQRSVGGLGGLGGMQTDPSMPNVAMPWQQPWGTPGFGQPGRGNSQGVGGYSPTGQQSTNQQGSQWGGVFGAKNPWSPA